MLLTDGRTDGRTDGHIHTHTHTYTHTHTHTHTAIAINPCRGLMSERQPFEPAMCVKHHFFDYIQVNHIRTVGLFRLMI